MPLPGVSALCDYGIQTHLLFFKTNIGKTRIFFKQRDATKREIAVMFVVILFMRVTGVSNISRTPDRDFCYFYTYPVTNLWER